MNISEVTRLSGLPAKTIRYYETIGLIHSPGRKANGYRDYSREDAMLLRFIRHARELGFGVEDCRKLVALFCNPNRQSREVKALALAKIEEIDRKLEEFRGMREELVRLAAACPGDDRPDCAILEELARQDR